MGHRIAPVCLSAYDIRGTVGRDLGPEDATAIGRSFGTIVRNGGGSRVAVGYDGRLSSPALEAALVAGLIASGIDVVRVGLGPSPMLYYAEAVLNVDGAVMVTGSHNPPADNGFKLVLGHRPFFGDDIVRLGAISLAGTWSEGSGTVADHPVLDDYGARLTAGHDGGTFRIGWDAGNGAAGPAIELLVRALPGEHHLLHTIVDGRFPNHHPDPTIPANLADLKALVLAKRLDMGFAFDGDGDRIGVIDRTGTIVPADQLLAILAEPVLRARPGATIIADVKASAALFDRVRALGGIAVMSKSGHAPIKAKMIETGAPLAGEMSGHIFFGHDYYGFDDALYAAVRLIAAIGDGDLAMIRAALATTVATPELRLPVREEDKRAIVDVVLARLAAAGAMIDTTDGARVTTVDGWWLLRASNTEPALTLRAEAADRAALDRLLDAIDAQLAASGLDPCRAAERLASRGALCHLRRMDDAGPTSHSFISQRLRLQYLDWGNATAPTLVLIHGGRDHARNWDWIARALRDEWHVVAPDLRGHGDSAWSPDGAYSMPYYVTDLAQLIHQQEGGPVTLVGHSLGGAIALRCAGLYPERIRRLVAIEGLGMAPPQMRDYFAQPVAARWLQFIEERRALSGRLPRRYATLEDAYARMRDENGFLSEEQARHLTIHGVSRNEDGSWSWKFDNYVRSIAPIDITDDELHTLWHRIDCPVWLVHGADSWASHPGHDGRAAYFRDAHVTSFEKAGHWVHHDRFDAFLTALRDFIGHP